MMFHFTNKLPQCPVPEAATLFQAGSVAEAFAAFGKALIQARNPALTESAEAFLKQKELLQQAEEPAVCTFIARLTQLIDACDAAARERLWDACLGALQMFPPETCVPRQDTTDRYVAECILLRHMEKPKEAFQIVLEGLTKQETASRATFAGLCALDLEDEEGAEKYICMGLRLDPNNASGCNDLADYYFAQRRYQNAADFYALVLNTSDHYDLAWAEPSFLFCRYMMSNQPIDLERLALRAAMEPQSDRITLLCKDARREQALPYVDYIPFCRDATVQMISSLREKDVKNCRLATTCLEAASAIHAVRLDMSQFGQREVTLSVSTSHIPSPPLDELLMADGVRLWNYDADYDTTPAVPAPSAHILSLVKGLAEMPFDLPKWYTYAKELAQTLQAEDVEELYGCMVFPPVPSDTKPLAHRWLLLVQYAAVCLLAHVDKKHYQTVGAEMQRYAQVLPSPELVRICFGQLDWPIIPALTLLAWQSKQGLAPADEVNAILDRVMLRVPKNDYCFFDHALFSALSWVPGRDVAFHQDMHRRRRHLEQLD